MSAFMKEEEIRVEQVIRNARMLLDLTQEEAGRLVGVTRRAWEYWEAGTRKIPVAAFELFIAKISGKLDSTLKPNDKRQIIVVVADDGLTPIDVVSNENFLSLAEDISKNIAVISSWAIDRSTGKPYKHKTRFLIQPHNEHVTVAGHQWREKLSNEEIS
jgi:transcriptional regulator with XRE-family HTH domain